MGRKPAGRPGGAACSARRSGRFRSGEGLGQRRGHRQRRQADGLGALAGRRVGESERNPGRVSGAGVKPRCGAGGPRHVPALPAHREQGQHARIAARRRQRGGRHRTHESAAPLARSLLVPGRRRRQRRRRAGTAQVLAARQSAELEADARRSLPRARDQRRRGRGTRRRDSQGAEQLDGRRSGDGRKGAFAASESGRRAGRRYVPIRDSRPRTPSRIQAGRAPWRSAIWPRPRARNARA